MHLKNLLLLQLLLFLGFCASQVAAKPVTIISHSQSHNLELATIEGYLYISTDQLAILGEGQRVTSYLKRKETLKAWNRSFVFTIFSPYMSCEGQNYNLILPAKYQNNQLLVPFESFFHIYSIIFDEDVRFTSDTLYLKGFSNRSSNTEPEQRPFKIVIDPGHGGKDPGAISKNGTHEKTVVLSIALKLSELLETNPNWEVILTRSEDLFLPLSRRTQIANEQHADLFISIHCNGSKNQEARGSECFYLSPAENDQARAAAALENASLLLEENPPISSLDEIEFILADMLQNEYLRESSRLAVLIQNEFKNNLAFPSRKVSYAPFYVLNGAFMPAVLVETAFITNDEDEDLLLNEEVQKDIALSLKNGIEEFRVEFLENSR